MRNKDGTNHPACRYWTGSLQAENLIISAFYLNIYALFTIKVNLIIAYPLLNLYKIIREHVTEWKCERLSTEYHFIGYDKHQINMVLDNRMPVNK